MRITDNIIIIKEFIFFALSGLCLFGTATCYYAAIEASTVSTAVILMYTAPVFVMVYSVFFLGEKLNAIKIGAVTLMIVGCALVSGVVGGVEFNLWGVVLGLSSGLCYSGYNIFTRIEMMKGYKSLSATMYCFIVMCIVAMLTCNPIELVSITVSKPLEIVPLIIGIGVVTAVLPYLFYTMALREIPAGTASALAIIEPMAATVFSVIIFNEKLTAISATGIVLILVAVFALNKSDK